MGVIDYISCTGERVTLETVCIQLDSKQWFICDRQKFIIS